MIRTILAIIIIGLALLIGIVLLVTAKATEKQSKFPGILTIVLGGVCGFGLIISASLFLGAS